jgi:hypothetical protein
MSDRRFPAGELLPTITTAYEPVEQYLDYLTAPSGPASVTPSVVLRPIDAVLLHFLASFQPGRARVLDLASAATYGASTVLSRTLPKVQTVYLPQGCANGQLFVLTRYFKDLPGPLADLVALDDPESIRMPPHPPAPLMVLLAATDENVADNVRHWLEPNPGAIAVVLGVGLTGSCPGLSTLVQAFSSGPYQLALLRELAPALANSSLAVVGPRGQGIFTEALFRMGLLFTDHFRYLDLVKQACHSALRQVPTAEVSRSGGVQEKVEEEFSGYALRQALDECTRELWALRNSLTVRMAGRVRRLLRYLAPQGSPQRWVARKTRSALRQLWRRPQANQPAAH